MKICSEDYTAKCNFAGPPQHIQYRGLGGEDNHFNNMQLSLTFTYNTWQRKICGRNKCKLHPFKLSCS